MRVKMCGGARASAVLGREHVRFRALDSAGLKAPLRHRVLPTVRPRGMKSDALLAAEATRST
jgi:hypothetical protein